MSFYSSSIPQDHFHLQNHFSQVSVPVFCYPQKVQARCEPARNKQIVDPHKVGVRGRSREFAVHQNLKKIDFCVLIPEQLVMIRHLYAHFYIRFDLKLYTRLKKQKIYVVF